MGTRKNEHQEKWAFGANVHFGVNGYLGQMDIGGMGGRVQIDIWENGHFKANEHFGTDGR